jgi:hypothetical protein
MALGLSIFAGGMPLLASYLMYHSVKSGGDVAILLLGETRGRKG